MFTFRYIAELLRRGCDTIQNSVMILSVVEGGIQLLKVYPTNVLWRIFKAIELVRRLSAM